MQMRWIKEIWQLACLARSSGHDIRYKILGDQLEVDVLTRNPKTFVIPKNEDGEERYQECINSLREMIKA